MANLIQEPFLLLSSHEAYPELIGCVSYVGDLGKEEPEMFVIDTHGMKLTLQYKSGREDHIAELNENDSNLVHLIENGIHDSGLAPQMGLFRHNEAGNMVEPCYNVDVILI